MTVQWYFLSAQSQIQEWRPCSKAEAGDYWTRTVPWMEEGHRTFTTYIPCGRYVGVLDTGWLRSQLLLCKTLSFERKLALEILLFNLPPPFLSTGEALHLSSDFHRLCENCFSHSELAQIIAQQHTGTPEAQPRISMVKAAQ